MQTSDSHVSRFLRIGDWAMLLAVVTAFSTSTVRAQPADSGEQFNGFDSFVKSVMSDWKVPGLAVAAIHDGEVVLAEGYGYRNVEERLPVTAETLFAIGSNSKSFTVTLLGMLNDEGLLDWDKPVREYLPGFQMHDPTATLHMTARDLVTHRSGLPRHDLVWYATDLSRRELFDRLRYLQPTKEFRSTYQYQNLMFMTAGYLAGQVADSDWETLAGEKILKRLGMERSNFSVDDMPADADFAFGYSTNGVEGDDTVVRIPFRNIDPVGPAGSINSSVSEMMRYVQFHIDQGLHGENRLLSKKNARQMQVPQMVVNSTGSEEDRDPELGDPTYGLGLSVSSYRGHKFVGHGGGIDGFISAMSWLPHDRIGVVVLTNFSGEANPVPNIVSRNVFDRLLELDPIDWNGRVRERADEQLKKRNEAWAKADAEQKKGTSPSHPLPDYEGEYTHPAYGTARVVRDGKDLKCTVAGFELPLAHFHYDIFAVPKDAPREIRSWRRRRVQFFYNKQGEIDRLAVTLEPRLDDIVFERIKPEQGADESAD